MRASEPRQQLAGERAAIEQGQLVVDAGHRLRVGAHALLSANVCGWLSPLEHEAMRGRASGNPTTCEASGQLVAEAVAVYRGRLPVLAALPSTSAVEGATHCGTSAAAAASIERAPWTSARALVARALQSGTPREWGTPLHEALPVGTTLSCPHTLRTPSGGRARRRSRAAGDSAQGTVAMIHVAFAPRPPERPNHPPSRHAMPTLIDSQQAGPRGRSQGSSSRKPEGSNCHELQQ